MLKPPPHFVLRLALTCIALIGVWVKVYHKDIEIDGITFGFVCLAIVPWLSELIKSLEITGIGKVEFQELKERAEKAEGAAQSAAQQASLAVQSGAVASSAKIFTKTLSQLAEEYNQLRLQMPPGDARTAAMTDVVARMMAAVRSGQTADLEAALKSSDGGLRLVAYAQLHVNPDPAQLEPLVRSVTEIENQPFGQYWGLHAVNLLLSAQGEHRVSEEVRNRLQAFSSRLQRGTDRDFELNRALKMIDPR